jgi:hypothetical protein
MCQAAAFAQDVEVTARPAEVPAQSLSDAPALTGSRLTFTSESGQRIHILPTLEYFNELGGAPADTGPLVYSGGYIMQKVNIYTIYWSPPTLQTGAATSFDKGYSKVLNQLAQDYAGLRSTQTTRSIIRPLAA